MRLVTRTTRATLAALAFAAISAAPLAAQVEVPSLRWQTIETANFRIHYEPQLEAWARQVGERIESVRSAVAARVGYSYPHKIDLIVEDPFNVSNGSAWPSQTFPAMRFWATPPSPTSNIGNSRGWGEMLAVHEYAHLAHLLRPSREPFALLQAIATIVPVGPLVNVPAWVSEGYATVIEGELTGSGRPNSALRPAIIRSLALEGYLPAYGELDATGRFNGGAMRYLIGSAYLEWLQAQRGDSALPQLWRRASARKSRNFATAFDETFGDHPAALYGRFVAEATVKAARAREQLERAGLAQGALVQRWNWNVGSPDVAPDGERIAVRRASPTDPGGIFIYTLKPDTAGLRRDSTALAKRLKKDPEDLAPYRAFPRTLRRVAALGPVAGTAFDAPRFFADGERLLVTRSVPMPDGRARSDLFEWHSKTGKVRRITRGAGIQLADPTPDGKQAAALTCGGGVCSLLRVDLADGRTTPLAVGTLDAGYAGVRVSPDGRRVATARQQGTRWVPVVIDLASAEQRIVGPSDDASRFSPAWENDSTLLVVSDASGGWEIERLQLNGGGITVAVRTLGAASAPEVGPDGRIWWLDLHGRGWDLRVNDAQSAVALAAPLDTALFPTTKRVNTRLAQQFEQASLPGASRYGLGPQGIAFLVTGTGGADGSSTGLGFTFGDPVGRGTGVVYAGAGPDGAWSGARAAYAWRGLRPALQLEGFLVDHRPSEHRRIDGVPNSNAFDRRYVGALLASDYQRQGAHGSTHLRVGGSFARVENPTLDSEQVDRVMGFAQLGQQLTFTPRATRRLSGQWQASSAAGRVDDIDFLRHTFDLRLAVETPKLGLATRVQGGEVNSDAPGEEYFLIGGAAPTFVDPIALNGRIDRLGLPFGITGGRRYGILTVESAGPLRLYHDWIVAGDEDFGETLRVLGGEFTLDVPKISVMRVPRAQARIGITHSLNGRARNTTQFYSGFSVTP